MTEQELTEKIAEEGVKLYAFPNLWGRLNGREKEHWRNWANNSIMPLIEEALPELAKEVRLADEQSLPFGEDGGYNDFNSQSAEVRNVVNNMLKAGWRKVILKEAEND